VASLLGRVREKAERFHRAEQDLARARDELRSAMAAAREEGVPIARLAREAGVSRPTAHEWLKQRSGA
jgi:DNA-directed RNA polymerase specialized sigma24 family protein